VRRQPLIGPYKYYVHERWETLAVTQTWPVETQASRRALPHRAWKALPHRPTGAARQADRFLTSAWRSRIGTFLAMRATLQRAWVAATRARPSTPRWTRSPHERRRSSRGRVRWDSCCCSPSRGSPLIASEPTSEHARSSLRRPIVPSRPCALHPLRVLRRLITSRRCCTSSRRRRVIDSSMPCDPSAPKRTAVAACSACRIGKARFKVARWAEPTRRPQARRCRRPRVQQTRSSRAHELLISDRRCSRCSAMGRRSTRGATWAGAAPASSPCSTRWPMSECTPPPPHPAPSQ
jgi:hypothetical protein